MATATPSSAATVSAPARSTCVAALLALPATPDAAADPLRPLLASLLAGRALGEGMLPAMLGLDAQDFEAMVTGYFPGMELALSDGSHPGVEELADLAPLLAEHRAGLRASERWMVRIVCAGCMGADHLWQDLGLANRGELGTLMQLAFPGLSARNVTDMKWKKFLYRQFCAAEGLLLCPAPSCGVCADFRQCHAPED